MSVDILTGPPNEGDDPYLSDIGSSEDWQYEETEDEQDADR